MSSTPFSRILVAVDFQAPASAAFDHALALAGASGAELIAVIAIPPDRPFGWRARERVAVSASMRRAAKAAGVRFRLGVQHGDPAGVILLHARDRRPDLIVMGTTQTAGLGRLRSGSVAERVMARASHPVLIVPSSAYRTPGTAPRPRSIVAAVDFTEAGARAVDTALSLAGAGTVTLVHVVRGVSPASVPRHTLRPGTAEYQRWLIVDAWRRLQALARRSAGEGSRIRLRVIAGHPHEEVARLADGIGADLIVVGASARGRLGRAVFGSTAVRVVRAAGCPVLAVPEIGAGAPRLLSGAESRRAA